MISQINTENLRLLDSLKGINESDYSAKTEKIVGRMSIGNVGKGHTLPTKPWSDCYNEAIGFIRPMVRTYVAHTFPCKHSVKQDPEVPILCLPSHTHTHIHRTRYPAPRRTSSAVLSTRTSSC